MSSHYMTFNVVPTFEHFLALIAYMRNATHMSFFHMVSEFLPRIHEVLLTDLAVPGSTSPLHHDPYGLLQCVLSPHPSVSIDQSLGHSNSLVDSHSFGLHHRLSVVCLLILFTFPWCCQDQLWSPPTSASCQDSSRRTRCP